MTVRARTAIEAVESPVRQLRANNRELVLRSERPFRDPVAASSAVYDSLGLPPHRLKRYTPFLQGKYVRRLAEYFEPYNRELYRRLGQQFDWA